ncbi:hypothetical protein AAHE18_19G228000 [Arachis hypogaea]
MASPAKMQEQVLEINLISAQGLQPPSSPRRRLQTYALTWIDPSTKLRTRVDKDGDHNSTWNNKFLASDTSGISVAIYDVGTFRNHLIGTIRFLISNILSSLPIQFWAPTLPEHPASAPSRFAGRRGGSTAS